MNLAWVIHAYALTFGGLLLLGGKTADRYGRHALGLTLGAVLLLAATIVVATVLRRAVGSPTKRGVLTRE